jgi:hypothetical protein
MVCFVKRSAKIGKYGRKLRSGGNGARRINYILKFSIIYNYIRNRVRSKR